MSKGNFQEPESLACARRAAKENFLRASGHEVFAPRVAQLIFDHLHPSNASSANQPSTLSKPRYII